MQPLIHDFEDVSSKESDSGDSFVGWELNVNLLVLKHLIRHPHQLTKMIVPQPVGMMIQKLSHLLKFL